MRDVIGNADAANGRPENPKSDDGRPAGRRPSPSRSEPPNHPTEMPTSSWVTLLKRSVKQFKHDDITDRAAALTYFGVLAIFPGVLALVSVLGLLGKSATDKILSNLKQITPGAASSFLQSVIGQVGGKAGAAGIAGIVGIVLALYSASGYVSAFTRASNAIYEVDEGRPIWKTAPLRFVVTLALVIMLALSAIMVVVTGPIASQVGKAFGIGDTAVLIWDIAKWPILLIIVSLMFSLLYRACPNVKQPGLRWISLGGIVAVVVWLIASGLFALYVSFSGSYNKTYGSFATVIVFLVWLWISNIAVLLGAEFNAESQRERAIQAGLPEDTEPFVELRDTAKLEDSEKRRVDEADRMRAGYRAESGGTGLICDDSVSAATNGERKASSFRKPFVSLSSLWCALNAPAVRDTGKTSGWRHSAPVNSVDGRTCFGGIHAV